MVMNVCCTDDETEVGATLPSRARTHQMLQHETKECAFGDICKSAVQMYATSALPLNLAITRVNLPPATKVTDEKALSDVILCPRYHPGATDN